MREPLGVGVIGLGWVGGAHVRAYQGNPAVRLVAVAGRDLARTRARADELGLTARVYDDADALVRDPAVDLVSICTPHALHAQQAIAAAQAGTHVLVEKPVALTLAELRALRDAVRMAGVRAMASFVLRWNPLLLTIRGCIQDGTLGRLALARADYWNRSRHGFSEPTWWHSRAGAGSALLTGGCHAADALRWLVGAEAVEVFASATGRQPAFEFPPTIATTIRFADGTVGQLSTCLEGGLPYIFNVELIGERGAVRNGHLYRADEGQPVALMGTPPDSRDVRHHPFQAEIDAFVGSILHGTEPEASLEDAVRSHELCLAADLSAAEGRPVRLPLLD